LSIPTNGDQKKENLRINKCLIDSLSLIITLFLLSDLEEKSVNMLFKNSGTNLLLETETLFERIVQFRISIAELLATHEAFESLAETGSGTVPFSKGRHHLGMADYTMQAVI
jgi:hypothetical protein